MNKGTASPPHSWKGFFAEEITESILETIGSVLGVDPQSTKLTHQLMVLPPQAVRVVLVIDSPIPNFASELCEVLGAVSTPRWLNGQGVLILQSSYTEFYSRDKGVWRPYILTLIEWLDKTQREVCFMSLDDGTFSKISESCTNFVAKPFNPAGRMLYNTHEKLGVMMCKVNEHFANKNLRPIDWHPRN